MTDIKYPTQITVRVITDSVAVNSPRLTTLEMTYPRFIHSEFMTYRVFSRNSASSRAIPVQSMIDMVKQAPAMPRYWGKNKKGMAADEQISEADKRSARDEWLYARDRAVESAERMAALGVHKQTVNRILEPFCWITTVVTGTDWANLFAQRIHPAAQQEFDELARKMVLARRYSTPEFLEHGEWHTPFVRRDEKQFLTPAEFIKLSAARCARSSYMNHRNVYTHEEDFSRHDSLVDEGHWSPLGHQGTPTPDGSSRGPLRGWKQYREMFPNENVLEFDEDSVEDIYGYGELVNAN